MIEPNLRRVFQGVFIGAMTLLCAGSAQATPEINLNDGYTTTDTDIPDAGTGANFGTHNTATGSAARVYNIENSGTSTLNITSISVTGGDAGDFTLAGALAGGGAIAAGASATVNIIFNPSADGVRTTTLQIVSDDADEGTYDITLTGSGSSASDLPRTTFHKESFEQPAMAATYTVNDEHSDGVSDYFTRYEIGGSGTEDYVPLPSNPDGDFIFIAEDTDADGAANNGLMIVTLAAVDVTVFSDLKVVIALAESLGTLEADDHITLEIQPDGTGPFVPIGAWRRPTGTGGTLQEDTDFDGVGDGVALTADNNFSDFVQNVPVGSFSALVVRVLVDMDGPGEEVAFDNVRITGISSQPIIEVRGKDSILIENGDATPTATDGTDFEELLVGQSASQVFTVSGPSAAALNLTGSPQVQITGDTADFTVTMQPPASVASGGSESFTVQFSPTMSGARNAQISIMSDDTDRTPYTFSVLGQGIDPADWSHSMDVTFSGYAGVTTLTNFPALVVLEESNPFFSYGDVASASGFDLLFTSADGMQVLPYDVETWDATGQSFVWVRVPALTGTSTKITAYWGNATVTSAPNHATDGSAWSEGYEGVWHMNQLAPPDASGSGNDTTVSTGSPALVGGQVGGAMGALDFDGIDDGLEAGTGFSDLQNITVTTIFNAPAQTSERFWGKGDPGNNSHHYSFLTGSDVGLTDNLRIFLRDASGSDLATDHFGDFTPGAWQFSAVTFDAGGNVEMFEHGGVTSGTTSTGGQNWADLANGIFAIGHLRRATAGQFLDGMIDEMRVSSVIRSDDWLKAVNDNIFSNSTFVAFSSGLAPEIDVRGNSQSISDGDAAPETGDHTDFGKVSVSGGAIQRTFTIQNAGPGALTINSIAVSGAHAADFTLGPLSPAGPIPTAGSATFTATFSPAGEGARMATITVNNDDADEGTYDFAVSGTGAAAGAVLLVEPDDFADGAELNTAFTEVTLGTSATAGVGPSIFDTTAGFEVGGLATTGTNVFGHAGLETFSSSRRLRMEFHVAVNEVTIEFAHPDFFGPHSGVLEIYDSDTNLLDSVTSVPVGTTVASTTMTLSRPAADIAFAVAHSLGGFGRLDILRIGIGPAVAAPEINVNDGALTTDADIADGGAATGVGNVVAPGSATAQKTFNIDNATGTAALTIPAGGITFTGGAAADFSVSGITLPVTIPTGNSTTFVVTFDPGAVGTRTTTMQIASDDADEDPYDITLTGQGIKADPVITWADTADITFGTALSGTQLNATASTAGTFVYNPASGTTLNAGNGQILSVTFTPTDTANFNPVMDTATINVLKADPVITWADPADITFGTALSGAQLNATASTAGTFVYNPASGTTLNAGNGQALSVTFTPTDTANFNIVMDAANLDVLKATPVLTITGDSPDPSAVNGSYTVSWTLPAVGSGAAPGGTVTVTDGAGNSSGAVAASANSASLTSTTAGAKTLTASYSGDGNYNAVMDTETHGVNPAPEIAIGAPSVTDTSSGPVIYTVTYTDATTVTLANGDITLNQTGTANGTVAVSGTGSSTRTVTISGITGEGTLGISIAANTASDAANNQVGAAGPSTTFNVDNTAPGIAIGTPSVTDTSSGPVTYIITYTGADAISLAAGDVSLNPTGTATGSIAVFGAGTTTRTVTISNISGNGTLGISLAGSTASDNAGNNAPAAGPSTTFNVDNMGPGIAISAPSVSDTMGGPVTYTVTYTDATSVTLANGDIALNKTGSADGTVAVSGTGSSMRTVTISGVTGEGTLGISIAANTASDAANNQVGAAGPSTTFNVDNAAPGIAIGAPSVTDTSSGPVTYTITYTGAGAVSLANGDVSLNTTGTATGSIAVSGTGTTTRTVTISNISGNGTLGISIAGSTANDSAGNNAPAVGPSAIFNVDNMGPGIAISAPSVSDTMGGPVTYTVTYTDATTVTLANGDITLNQTGTANGTVAVSGTGSSTRMVTISGITGEGTLGISIAANTASDAANNQVGAAGPSTTFNVDNTAPGIAISAPSVTDTSTGPVSYTITYTGADAISLANGDVSLNTTGNATGSIAVSGTGTTTRTVTISNISGNGTLGISLAGNTASDNTSNNAPAAGPSATFNVDNMGPGIAISAPSVSDTMGGPVTYTVTYTDATTVTLANGDITLNQTGTANGTVAVSGTGSSTRTVTISGITGEGTLGISIAANTASDAANNQVGAAGPSSTFNVDNTAPGIAISAPSVTDTSSGPVTYTITYTGADAISLANGDVSLNTTGNATGSIAVSGTGTTTRTVTISNISGNGTLGISIAGSTASDNAGNNAPAAGPSATFNVDNMGPGIAISAPSVTDTSSGPVIYTVTYTDATSVTLANGDITLNKTGTADGNMAVSGTGTSSRTVTISNITGDGTLGISIAANTASDAANNQVGAAGPSTTFNVDNTAPGIAIGAPSVTDTASGPVTYTIAYTGADAISLANGDVSLNTTGNATGSITVSGTGTTTRTVTISNISGNGTLGISIAGNTASDNAGNTASAAGPSATFNVDNMGPGIAISAPSASDTMSGPVTYTVTYTDATTVTLANGDITLNQTGTANGLVAVSGTGSSTRTVTISGITGEGTLGISIAANTASDAANNQVGAAGPSTTFNVDNTAPGIAISAPSAMDTSTGPVTYTITYTGADAISLANGDVSLNTTGTATGSIAVSGTGTTTRTVTISNISGNGTLGISIAGSTANDSAGNNAPAVGPSATFNVDNMGPGIAISAPSVSDTMGGPVTYTVTYTDATTVTLAIGDITLNQTGTANGTVAVSGAGSSTRTVTISGVTGEGTLGISIAANTASDAANNQVGATGPSTTFNVDNTAPGIAISAPSVTDTSTGPVSYTITYTGADAVSLANGDITLNQTGMANGSVAVSGTGSSTRTVTISGITGEGTLGISIAANTASDAANNQVGAADPSTTFNVDNTAPGIAISAPSVTDTSTGPVTYTITYTGADAISLANGDVTLNTTGTATGSITVSGTGTTTRTVTISNISGDGTLGISIAGNTASDSAGNDAPAVGPSATFNVDNTVPTIAAGAPSEAGTSLGPVTYTITYGGANSITLAANDVTLLKTGTADGVVAVSGSGNTSRLVTISNISGEGTLGISIAANTATDAAGNNVPAVGASGTFTVTPPNTAPTVNAAIADFAVNEDAAPTTIDLTSVFADAETASADLVYAVTGNTNTALVAAAINHGTNLVLTLAADQHGAAQITVRVTDERGLQADDVFVLTVNAVNDQPTGNLASGSLTVLEDAGAQAATAFAVFNPGPANESGQGGNYTLSTDNNALFSSLPAIAANGTLTHTPAVDANGIATVTVITGDGGGTANGGVDRNTNTFQINVTAVNDQPAIGFATGSVVISENAGSQSVAAFANFTAGPTDEAGQSPSYTVSSDNAALFSIAPVIAANGTLTYTGAVDANGSATITVVVSDDGGTANGGVNRNTNTFQIAISSVNNQPSVNFTDANVTVLEDAGAQTVNAFATFNAGATDESGQTPSYSLTTDNASLFAAAPTIGVNRTLSFTGANDASGLATVTVVVMDDGGTANGGIDRNTNTFQITVSSVNDQPSVNYANNNVTVLEDAGTQTLNAFATFNPGATDESGQMPAYSLTTDNASLFASAPTIAANGTLTFTGADDANGSATVTVVVMDDGGTANGSIDRNTNSFQITVTSVNDQPSASYADNNVIVLEDAGAQTVNAFATFNPGATDESGQTPTYSLTADNSALFASAPTIAANGTLTFTGADDANGSATVTVVMDDGGTAHGGIDRNTNTFQITVTSVNDQPSANYANNNVTVLEDAGAQTLNAFATFNPGATDESGQMPIYSLTTDNSALFASAPTVAANGTLTFTGANDANGMAMVTVVVMDDGGTANGGVDRNTNTFQITVTAVNDQPSATYSTNNVVVLEDAGAQTLNAFATFNPGPADEAAQTAFYILMNDNNALFNAQPVMTPGGDLSFTPAADVNGSATITVVAQDTGGIANGGENMNTNSFQITVTSVNDQPSASYANNTVTVLEDAGRQTVAAFASFDPGASDEVGQSANYTLSSDNIGLFLTGPNLSPSGELSFATTTNANGNATITVVVQDSGGTLNGGVDRNTNTFEISVTPVNDLPIADNDSYTMDQGDVLTVAAPGVLIGDADVENDSLSAVLASTSAQPLSLLSTGGFTYTPDTNFWGDDSFTYHANDGSGDSVTSAMVDIRVLARPSNAVPVSQTLFANTTLRFSSTNQPLANALVVGDPDSANLSLSLSVTNGTLSLGITNGLTLTNGDSGTNIILSGAITNLNAALESLSYTPRTNFFGDDTLRFISTDEGGRTNRGNATVPILIEVPAVSGQEGISLAQFNNPPVVITNAVLIAAETNLIAGIAFNPTNSVLRIEEVSGQDGSTNRTRLTIRLMFGDGSTRDVVIPTIIYYPLLTRVDGLLSPVYAGTFDTPIFNPQTSLFEQQVAVQNNTPFDFNALRLTATNLPPGVILQNATITNGSQSFIDYNLPIPSGAQLALRLEYFSPDLMNFTPGLKLELQRETRAINVPTNVVATEITPVTGYTPDGSMLRYLQFPTTSGQLYYIQYTDTMGGTWKTSPVIVTGTGLIVNWLDNGPPSTATPPGALRFYRILSER